MPLPMKTLAETAQMLGLSEAEIRAQMQMGKIRAVMKNGALRFAPDEIARLSRQRKSLPESSKK